MRYTCLEGLVARYGKKRSHLGIEVACSSDGINELIEVIMKVPFNKALLLMKFSTFIC